MAVEYSERMICGRYERGDIPASAPRSGYEPSTLKIVECVTRVRSPNIRGLDEQFRSHIWSNLKRTNQNFEFAVCGNVCGVSNVRMTFVLFVTFYLNCAAKKFDNNTV